MMNNENEIRSAAQSIYENIGAMNARAQQSSVDITRSHSINLITEEFLGGYTQDGRMSVVRRFFCLFVTFDLFFISLLWLICIMITGDNIYNALKTQVVHYTIYTSLFDVVMAAICRFIVLLLFYALLYINHWLIIACSTSGSCLFLISKVFVYDWVKSPEPVFQVVLIVTSFVLAWGEAWFLDCRVIPQERHARNYFLAITSNNYAADRSSLLAPLLASDGGPPTESHLTFYSPYDSRHDSDEEDEKDDEYKKMGKECVRKAYELLETKDWKMEKVSSKGDRIQSTQKDKLGKIYRLTAIIRYPAKNLLEELFYRIEDVPKWNPTLLESKIIRKVDTHTDISYQATVGGGGGLVQSRDFVNLRCWQLCCNGKVVDTDDEDEDEENTNCCGSYEPSTAEGSVSTLSDEEALLTNEYTNSVTKSVSEARIREGSSQNSSGTFLTLSKSLGAKDFRGNFISEPPPLDDEFTDATDNPDILVNPNNDRIYISAAISVDYPGVPNNPKYTRGQNLVSCWAMREIPGKPDSCIFEWLLCLDLKGYIPRYVLDSAYTSLMQDYMTYLRKYIKELRQKKRKVPDRAYS